ncbi:MAG: tetratricopeptide repeat protein [Candidatus Glassbacteria bacterium]
MTRKRITKKQLKEDAFVTAAFEAEHYLREHLGLIIGGVLGAVALVGLVWMFVNYRIDRRDQASLALFKAEVTYLNGQFAIAATDFENLANQYSGTLEAAKALYLAGDSFFKNGDMDRALEMFNRCREEMGSSDPLMVNLLTGIGACHEQLKEYDQAEQLYRQAEQAAEYDFQRVEVLSSLSRVLRLAGREAEAIDVLTSIIDRFPDSPRKGEFIELRAELQARSQAAAKS